jgi:hypothetical protein
MIDGGNYDAQYVTAGSKKYRPTGSSASPFKPAVSYARGFLVGAARQTGASAASRRAVVRNPG